MLKTQHRLKNFCSYGLQISTGIGKIKIFLKKR